MTKINKLLAFFMAIASLVAIQGCDDDEDPKPAAPTVTAPPQGSAQVGSTVTLNFSFETPGGFKSSSVTATGGTAAITTDGTAGSNSGQIVVTFAAGNVAGAGSVTLTVTDEENQSREATATITISLNAPPTIALSNTAVSGVPGGTVVVTVTVNAANGAESITVTGATTTPASPIAITGTTDVATEVTVNIPGDAVVGSVINVFFTATDVQDLASTAALLSITVEDPEPLEVLEGNITNDITLDASKKYLLRGKVYVNAPAKLTIPAGTIIFGEKNSDGALIINRGASIDARGTAENPIIMTSQAPKGFRNRGDWGGVVILGNAYNNNNASATIEGVTATGENGLYGPGTGNAIEDQNSGFLQYVRIEYAGIALSPDNELNSLTMGSVGSGTTIDHIMVSYANDDAYEWFGGSVNHKYLIAYSTNDDDFDSDRGYNGKVQFGLIVRDYSIADISGSRAFEASSGANAATIGAVSRHSMPVFSNITVLGPRLFGNNIDTDYRAAVDISSNSAIKIHNSIITGFTNSANFVTAGATISGNVFAANATQTATGANAPASFDTDNTLESTITNIFGPFTSGSLYSTTNLPVMQVATSPYLTGSVDLSADSFFENVPYKGAFGETAAAEWNYSSAWVNFDPNNADY